MLPFHTLTTTRTARYLLLNEPGPDIRSVWFCLHNEGQPLAELAQQLVPLDVPERLLVLPEALSRYNLPAASPGQDPVPVATWLASGADELTADFNDLTAYLNTLARQVLSHCPPEVPVTVLGCGQGAAAACSWLATNQINYERLILYAAVLPPQFDRRTTFAALPERPVQVVATTVDVITPEAAGEALVQDLVDAGLPAQLRHVMPGPITLAALGPAADGTVVESPSTPNSLE